MYLSTEYNNELRKEVQKKMNVWKWKPFKWQKNKKIINESFELKN